MSARIFSLALACLALSAAAGGMWVARELSPAAPHLATGSWLPRPRGIGPISLVDQSDTPFTATRLRGAPSLLYFGFTHCPDVCPTTLVALARVERSGAVPNLRVFFVTLDPARDRPALLAAYVHAFDPRFVGLTGSQQAIDALAARLGVWFQRIALPGGDYTIDHTAALFLLDAAGRNVAVFTAPFDAAALARDLRRAAPYLVAAAGPTERS